MQPKGHIARFCQNSNRNKGKSHSSLRSQQHAAFFQMSCIFIFPVVQDIFYFIPEDKNSLQCTTVQGRIKGGGATGQLPRAPRCKGVPRDDIYFQIKYSFENFLWFRSDTIIQLYIIFLCCVKYQEPAIATDFSTRGVSNSFSLRAISTLWLPSNGQF